MYYFLQSELLSRRLAHFCCKRISNIFNEYSNCFFEKTIKRLQKKSSSSSDLTKSLNLSKNSSNTNLLSSLPQSPLNQSQQQQQQQKSPDLNPNSSNNSTKLKPFVTNLASAPANQVKHSNASTPSFSGPTEVVNYILKKDVSVKSVIFSEYFGLDFFSNLF